MTEVLQGHDHAVGHVLRGGPNGVKPAHGADVVYAGVDGGDGNVRLLRTVLVALLLVVVAVVAAMGWALVRHDVDSDLEVVVGLGAALVAGVMLVVAALNAVSLPPAHLTDLLALTDDAYQSGRDRLFERRHGDLVRVLEDQQTPRSYFLVGLAGRKEFLAKMATARRELLDRVDAKGADDRTDLVAQRLYLLRDWGLELVTWVARAGQRRALQVSLYVTFAAAVLLAASAVLTVHVLAGMTPVAPKVEPGWGEQVWVRLVAKKPAWTTAAPSCLASAGGMASTSDVVGLKARLAYPAMPRQSSDGPFKIRVEDALCKDLVITVGRGEGSYTTIAPTQLPASSPTRVPAPSSPTTAVPARPIPAAATVIRTSTAS